MKTNIICIALVCLFLLIALTAGYRWYEDWKASREAEAGFREIQALVTEPTATYAPEQTTTPEPAESLPPKTAYDTYSPLYQQNPQFLGWIHIDGTTVDYPVMYAPNQPGFYLRRGFYGKSSSHGVPYLEEGCAPGLSNNLILYGHNMKDGSMFHDLLNYADKEFREAHQYIQFDTTSDFSTTPKRTRRIAEKTPMAQQMTCCAKSEMVSRGSFPPCFSYQVIPERAR